jgi:hypothetical protein
MAQACDIASTTWTPPSFFSCLPLTNVDGLREELTPSLRSVVLPPLRPALRAGPRVAVEKDAAGLVLDTIDSRLVAASTQGVVQGCDSAGRRQPISTASVVVPVDPSG